MNCPNCKSNTSVINTRPSDLDDNGTTHMRRRECRDPDCRHRFTTYEITCSREEMMALVCEGTVKASLLSATDDQLMAEVARRIKVSKAAKAAKTQIDVSIDPFNERHLRDHD